MKKNKLLISALCVGMAVAQMPVGVFAAVEDPEEIISETEPAKVISEGSVFLDFSADGYTDIVEADFAHPSFLDDYGFEELFPLTLEGVVPDGDPDVSHLYTLHAGETLEFTDGVTDEVAVTYSEGDTLALCKGGSAVIKFKPASYDPARTYNVYAVYNEGYDDMPGDVTDLGNGSYSMEVSYAAMMLNIHGVIDPSSYVPGEFAGGSGTASDPYQIATYDQLKLMGTQTQEGLYYKLIADITANTSEPGENSPNVWTPVDPKECYFDGAGHTIKNLCLGTETVTVTEYDREVEKVCSALFSSKGTAQKIENVTVQNVYFKGDAQRQASLALNVKDMTNCKISGKIARSNDLADPYSFSLSTYKLPYFAGLAYSSSGMVSKCTYDAQFEAKVVTIVSGIVYSAANISECVTTENAYLKHDADSIRGTTMMDFWMIPISGAVAGIANKVEPEDGKTSVVKDNVNNATIDAQCSHNPHKAAGIVISASSTSGTVEASGNINNGSIKGLEAGGIAVSLNGKISDCKNTGKIEGYYSAAGIVRNIYKGAVVSNCVNEGNILVTDGSGSGIKDEFYGAAGLIGEANDVDLITNCINSGKIESAAASSGMMGWVTYSKSSKV